MRKPVYIVLCSLLALTTQAAVLVDDFESYAAGAITSPWVVTDGSPVFGQEAGGNQYLESYGSYLSLGSDAIADSDTETTVFFRVYELAGTGPDCSVGLSHIAAPTGDWNDFEAYVVLVGGNLQARNNTGNSIIVSGISEATWYNIWVVLNNSANTYDVYMTTGSDDATIPGAQKADDFGFRNDAGDLVTFKVFGRDWAPVRVDDIYISTGTHLTIPSGTSTPPAVIVSSPADRMVHETQTASFNTVFTSESTPVVTWYKVASPTDITMNPGNVLTTYDALADEYTSTLTISNTTMSDAGQYYCQVNNDSGYPCSSDAAALTVYGLIAHWTLDQSSYVDANYLEEIGGYHAAVNGTPTFVAGADGITNNAVQITAADGWALCPPLNPVNQSGQLTVSFWANWSQSHGTRQDLKAESSQGDQLVMTDGLMADGHWQHICAVFDGTGPNGKLYVDGLLQDQTVWPVLLSANATINIGIDSNEENPFNGALDDMRLYNYALTAAEVGVIHDAWDTCSLVYDLTGPAGLSDCTVDVYDLAAFSNRWLTPPDDYDMVNFADFSTEWLSSGL